MVPYKFSLKEIKAGRNLILSHLSSTRIRGKGNFSGDPLITYQKLVEYVSNGNYHIDDEYDGIRAGHLAGAISEQEFKNNKGPLLSAVVVDAKNRKPGVGFFSLAGSLGLIPIQRNYDSDGLMEMVFWNKQLCACVKKYGKK